MSGRSKKKQLGYREIAAQIAAQISEGELQPGDRLPTEVDLARSYSVNRFTVRRALALLHKQGRISRHQGRGTFVTDPSGTQRDTLIYLGDLSSHFHKDLFLSLSSAGRSAGFHVIGEAMLPGESSGRSALLARINRADWIVVNAADHDLCRSVASVLSETARNVILVGRGNPCEKPRFASQVLFDRQGAVRMAFDHLAQLGHSRISLVTVASDDGQMMLRNEFQNAFECAAAERGLSQSTATILLQANDTDTKVIRDALQDPATRPTALLCDADFRAKPAYRAIAELGLQVPRDISVIAIGNTPWCEALSPELTSISYGEEAIARTTLALCRLGVQNDPLILTVAPRIVARQSCAEPQAHGPLRSNGQSRKLGRAEETKG